MADSVDAAAADAFDTAIGQLIGANPNIATDNP
jgi:hypothetical protein